MGAQNQTQTAYGQHRGTDGTQYATEMTSGKYRVIRAS
jgi:hypothetical protein